MSMLHAKQSRRPEEEATALATSRHPGVVELVQREGREIRTRHVEGRVLSDMGLLPPEEAAGLGAAISATLADLHDLGVVHGGVDASHVIVAADGHPVLCSLGRGGDPADDVAAVGRLITSITEEPGPDPLRARVKNRLRRRRLGPMLSPAAATALRELAAAAAHPDPSRRPDARALAFRLRDRIPAARLPVPETETAPDGSEEKEARTAPQGPTSWRWAGMGAAALLAVTVLAAWAWTRPESPRRARPQPQPLVAPGPPPTSAAPPARMWPPEPLHYQDGVLTFRGARYAVGQPGDTVAAGDWACTGQPTLALLRPSTGEVFAFDGWAGGPDEITARRIGRVEGASSLRTVTSEEDGGCQQLEVVRGDDPPVRLEVPR